MVPGVGVAAAVAHVDVFVGVHDEVIEGVIAVVIEEADVDVAQIGNPGRRHTAGGTPPEGIERRLHTCASNTAAVHSRDAAESNNQGFAGPLRLFACFFVEVVAS